MQALDGNAIAAPLFEHFGVEMTAARGACKHCGATAQIAELVVYPGGPGTVVRCRSCHNVVIVLLTIRDTLQVHPVGFELGTPPPSADSEPG